MQCIFEPRSTRRLKFLPQKCFVINALSKGCTVKCVSEFQRLQAGQKGERNE